MILKVKKTKEGSEWNVSNKGDTLNRWSGTVNLSTDENDISCHCTQSNYHDGDCTHMTQVREYLERNGHKIEEIEL